MTKVIDKAIAEFVAAVKQAMDGQDPQVVADLTDNLEADLLDRQAVEGAEFKLGSPRAFANELLASAGLATDHQVTSRGKLIWRTLTEKIWGFLKAMRPAWWAFRAYLAFIVIMWFFAHDRSFFPTGIRSWTLLAILIVISGVIGRKSGFGLWRKWWLRAPLAVLNVVAVLISLGWAAEVNQNRQDYGQLYALFNSDLLLHNGRIVSFAYAYDKNGKQLPMAQLKDGNGTILFQPPAESVLPDVLSGLVGGTLRNAVGVLTFLKYNNVKIDYQHVPAFKPGRVASVQLVQSEMGDFYVQLTVSR